MKNFKPKLTFNNWEDVIKKMNKTHLTIEQYANKKKIGYRQGKQHVMDGKINVLRPKATVLIDKKEV